MRLKELPVGAFFRFPRPPVVLPFASAQRAIMEVLCVVVEQLPGLTKVRAAKNTDDSCFLNYIEVEEIHGTDH
jgi:hypothetical protein